jgi:hypothetical protein
MPNCGYSNSCIFFNKKGNIPPNYEQLRNKYCYREFSVCFRFRLSELIGIENVPFKLLPVTIETQMKAYGIL